MTIKASGLKLGDLKPFTDDSPGLTGPWIVRLDYESGIFPKDTLVCAATDGKRLALVRLPETLDPILRACGGVFKRNIKPETVKRLAQIPLEGALAILTAEDFSSDCAPPELEHVAQVPTGSADDTFSTASGTAMGELEAILSRYMILPRTALDLASTALLDRKYIIVRGVRTEDAWDYLDVSSYVSPVRFPDRVCAEGNDKAAFDASFLNDLCIFLQAENEVRLHSAGNLAPFTAVGEHRAMLLMPVRVEDEDKHLYTSRLEPLLHPAFLKKQWLAPRGDKQSTAARIAGSTMEFPSSAVGKLIARWELGAGKVPFDLEAAKAYVQPERKPHMFLFREWAAEACRLERDLFVGTFLDEAKCPNWDTEHAWKRWWGVAVCHGQQAAAFRKAIEGTISRVSAYDWPDHKKNETLKDLDKVRRQLMKGV